MKKRFTIQFVFVIAVTLIISTVFYFLICKGLRLARHDAVGKFNYIINDTAYYNTVFFGTSTIRASVNAPLFDSLTGNHSFNASMDGVGITEINILVHKYLKSHGIPKHIFIGFDELMLTKKIGVWYFPQYYPFVNDTDMNELIATEPKLLLGKYFPPAAVTFFDDPLKNLGLIGLIQDYKQTDYNIPFQGFGPIRNKVGEAERTEAHFYGSVRGWELVDKTLSECRSKNISVSFLLSPRLNYFIGSPSAPFLEKLKYYEKQYGVRIFDYSMDKRFQSKELYSDRRHLNEEGATLFTTVLAKDFPIKP